MTKFDNFLKEISCKTVDVIGMGVSNLPLIKLLCKNGAIVTVCDKNENIDKTLLDGFDVNFILGEHYLENLSSEIIFRTPGLNALNKHLINASKKGSIITSEMEIFFEVCPCKIIGVTGSDGKTTTSTLISKILENDGYKVHLGGNIGKPLLCDVPDIKETDICVVELSSFQLQSMKKSPDIAVITNLTPNHLDIHKDMAEYEDAKKNIFIHQNNSDVFVTNLDDPITKDYKSNGMTLYFSRYKNLKQSVYLDGDDILINLGDRRLHVMKKQDIALMGEHNVTNYLTAICATYHLVDASKIIDVAKTFTGVEHRIEFVREFSGVRYYNDSIASSPTRAIAGLNSFDQKIVLIAGGYDKNLSFEPLAKIVSQKVEKLILVGHTATKIHDEVRKVDTDIEIIMCDNFTQAVETSRNITKSGDIVMLSPACASFDFFKNFVERGNKFKEIVNSFI